MTLPTILIADDGRSLRGVFGHLLRYAGYMVRITGSAAMLRQWIESGEGNLIIADAIISDEAGEDMLPWIRHLRPDLRILTVLPQEAGGSDMPDAAVQAELVQLMDTITHALFRPSEKQAERQAGEQPYTGYPDALAGAVEQHIGRYLSEGQQDTVRNLHSQVIEEVERPLIRMTLAATKGNQIRASAILGLNRNTLRKKIRDLNIPVVRGSG